MLSLWPSSLLSIGFDIFFSSSSSFSVFAAGASELRVIFSLECFAGEYLRFRLDHGTSVKRYDYDEWRTRAVSAQMYLICRFSRQFFRVHERLGTHHTAYNKHVSFLVLFSIADKPHVAQNPVNFTFWITFWLIWDFIPTVGRMGNAIALISFSF